MYIAYNQLNSQLLIVNLDWFCPFLLDALFSAILVFFSAPVDQRVTMWRPENGVLIPPWLMACLTFVPRALHIGTEHAIYILHKNGVSCWSHWQDQWMIQCQTKVNRISCFSSLCSAFSTFDWNIVFINHCWQMDKSELCLLYFLVFYGDDAPAPTRGKPAPVASVVLC